MATPLRIKSFAASGAIAPYTIAAYTATDGQVAPAAAGTDRAAGVVNELGAVVANEMVDVIQGGSAELRLGGTVPAGSYVMSDANGAAIVAAKSNGQTIYYVGQTERSGVAGDIVPLVIAPGIIVG